MSHKLFDTYCDLLKDFITFKSISTDPQYLKETADTADFLSDLFSKNGFTSEVIPGYDNPLVLAHYEADPQAETVLIYGHYDVQPAKQEDGWDNDPFTLDRKNERLFARGAIDNKGQIMIHIATVLDLIKNNNLKYNVKFFIEGNEETGSPNVEKFVRKHVDKLQADYILVSDGELVGKHPLIEVGFRGAMNATLTVKTSHTELHSGLFGGTVPNAAHEMSKFIAGLHKNINMVCIPGFYDDVQEPTDDQIKNNRNIPFDSNEYLKIAGTKHFTTENDYDVYTQTGLRPSLEVTGIHSGYTETGYKNGVPPHAIAKFNFRFVANQKPDDIAQKFEKYIDDTLPDYVTWDIRFGESAKPVFIDVDNPIFKHVKGILEKVYEEKVIYKYVGGSIPIIGTFQEILNVPQLLIPLANEDCNMHGVHENFTVDLVNKALSFSEEFFKK